MPASEQPSLLICLGRREAFADILETLKGRPLVALVKPEDQPAWADLDTLPLRFREGETTLHFRTPCLDPAFLAELKDRRFASVIIPSWAYAAWRDNALETLAAAIGETVEVISPDGHSLRGYTGEAMHRLIYNKAYLTSLFTAAPFPAATDRVLEVGCSDGLACDLLAGLGAGAVHGVDLWTENVGSVFKGERTTFSRGDANRLDFPDGHFDLVYSIATFEHLLDPWQVLEEMHRVTRIGGCLYVQAGPLYHSPFGHHMFTPFADLPWAHLRFPEARLAEHIRAGGHEPALLARGTTPEAHVHGMLAKSHVNGLFLEQYGLEAFALRHGAEVLMNNVSYEGRELLTPELRAEMPGYPAEALVEHGFELCLRRTR